MQSPINKFLAALQAHGCEPRKRGKGWRARVPGREDQHPSLDIDVGEDGRVLIIDRARKSSAEEIVASLGLKISDLNPLRPGSHNGNGQGRAKRTAQKTTHPNYQRAVKAATWKVHQDNGSDWQLVATFNYPDRNETLVGRVLRFEAPDHSDKMFVPLRVVRGGWQLGRPEPLWPLYHAHELIVGERLILTEGEGKCDLLRALGLNATSTAGGSKAARNTDFSQLAGATEIILWADNDESGRSFVAATAQRIHQVAPDTRIKILNVPGLPEGGDAKDFIAERRADGKDDAAIVREINDLIDSADVWSPEASADAEPITDHAVVPAFKSARQLLADHPCLRPPVIHGLIRQGETMNIIAASKTGKTWLVILIALCVAAGRMLFGRFTVEQGEVLIIDNELHGETIAHRLPRVAEALGLQCDEWVDRLFVENLRGRLVDLCRMEDYFAALEPGRFKIIILDAFYRFLPKDTDENDNGSMANLYNLLDRFAARLGCVFILIHHASKGVQSDKAITDVGAGAGAQSRAADTHLILRHHETDGAFVLDAAVRSWAPLEPFCLRWDFPIWKPAPDLDPTDLRKSPSRRRKNESEEPSEPAAEPWTAQQFASQLVTSEPQEQALIVARARQVMSGRAADDLLRLAIADRLVFRWAFPKTNKVYLANREQSVMESAASPDIPPPHARTPHTPRGTQERPRGGDVGAGETGTKQPGETE